jgi:hypothetical protein
MSFPAFACPIVGLIKEKSLASSLKATADSMAETIPESRGVMRMLSLSSIALALGAASPIHSQIGPIVST